MSSNISKVRLQSITISHNRVLSISSATVSLWVRLGLFPSPVFCSMKMQRGKAWEIWSCAVTLDKQRVDTRGAVPDCTHCSNPYFALNYLWRREQQTVLMLPCERSGLEICQAPPPMCLSNITAHDQISQAFSLHVCILQVIKYWRWEWPGNEAVRLQSHYH